MGEHGAGSRGPQEWGVFLVGLLFSAVSLYFSYGILTSQGQQQDAAANFVPVLATIVESSVTSRPISDPSGSGNIRTHTPRIVYDYQVDGQTYRSRRFAFLSPSYSGADGARAIVGRYPVGARRTAYHDPRDPGRSVLQRVHAPLKLVSGPVLVPAVLLCVSMLMLLAGWRGWLKKLREN